MTKKAKKYQPEQPENPAKLLIQEPVTMYSPIALKKIPDVSEFNYKRFQKIADKVPITQREWASILHLSERTLQRYHKSNLSFEGIYVDRILQMEQLIDAGLEAFADADTFYRWLKRDKAVLGHLLNFESLYSAQGIQLLHNEISRIRHGVHI